MDQTCEILEKKRLDEIEISQEEYNTILNVQSDILNLLASHGNSTDILARLCILAESLLPNSVASIMLLDQTTGLISILSAPSVPKIAQEALRNTRPSPGGGSCGNAVFLNEAQYVQDTFTDMRWMNIRQVAYDFNLRSCWSMPVRDESKKAIGTFALSSFEHRAPAPFHKKLLETAATIVNIVLKNKDDEQRIKLFSRAIQNAAEGMIITDTNNKIIEVNNAFEKIYGYLEKDLIGKDPNTFASGQHNKEFYNAMWTDILNKQQWSGEVINKRSDSTQITQWMSISALNDANSNKPLNYLAIFSDLTELKNYQSKIQRMAYTDLLTGLENKASLENIISKSSEQTLILLNVNNFSYINTAYGFEIGDKTLIQVANILKNYCFASHIARINSDEFALLFNGKINLLQKITDIQEYFIHNQIEVDDLVLNISFSYGASDEDDNLLRNSALALKQAKSSGKNRYYIYNQDKDNTDHSKREAFIASNNLLLCAIKADQIVPFFQGIRDNKSGEITKYEVLVRIVNDTDIISPFTFLEPARLSGLLPEITKIMIDKSFKKMTKNNYTFSINITEEDLSLHYLVQYLEDKLLEYNIDASRVILEILEGVSADGKKSHIKQLKTLKDKGFSIAIDDFGTEYSNFERVLDLEIDFLKIDARYIKDIDTNTKSYEITRAIAFFAKNAGIPCIAEFVHSEAVQKIVEELGIDYSQGYLFSEPKPLF